MFIAYVFSLVLSLSGTKIIPELIVLTRQIVSKVKLVLSSFHSTADIPRVALSPVKRPTRTVRPT